MAADVASAPAARTFIVGATAARAAAFTDEPMLAKSVAAATTHSGGAITFSAAQLFSAGTLPLEEGIARGCSWPTA
jgi:hypothetical protein